MNKYHPYRRADRNLLFPVCPAFSYVQFLFFRTEYHTHTQTKIFLSISSFKNRKKPEKPYFTRENEKRERIKNLLMRMDMILRREKENTEKEGYPL